MAKDANESNRKAALTASLGLCAITREKGKVVGGICPALGGEMAHVKFHRHPTSVQVMSCRHHQFSGGSHPCEANHNGLLCYHAKAILIQSANETEYDLEFSATPTEGSIPIFAHPGKINYMKATPRPASPPPAEKIKDKCEVCKGNRGGVPGNENVVNGKMMCDSCHSDHLEMEKLRKIAESEAIAAMGIGDKPKKKSAKKRK